MGYNFNRETVRFELGQQVVSNDGDSPLPEVGFDLPLDQFPDPVLEVRVEGQRVHGRFNREDNQVILDAGLQPGETVEVIVYAEVVVREASRLVGLRRSNLIQEALDWLKEQGYEPDTKEGADEVPEEIWQTFLVGRFERGACLAAAEAIRGVPDGWMTVEGFAGLMPEGLVTKWTDATYRLNPHWDQLFRPQEDTEQREEEKKSG